MPPIFLKFVFHPQVAVETLDFVSDAPLLERVVFRRFVVSSNCHHATVVVYVGVSLLSSGRTSLTASDGGVELRSSDNECIRKDTFLFHIVA